MSTAIGADLRQSARFEVVCDAILASCTPRWEISQVPPGKLICMCGWTGALDATASRHDLRTEREAHWAEHVAQGVIAALDADTRLAATATPEAAAPFRDDTMLEMALEMGEEIRRLQVLRLERPHYAIDTLAKERLIELRANLRRLGAGLDGTS